MRLVWCVWVVYRKNVNVSVHRLACFVIVTRRNRVATTTQHLRVTRPPLDRRVGTLRRRLNIRLLRQRPHDIALASTNRVLCHQTQRVIALASSAHQRVTSFGGNLHNALSVKAMSSSNDIVLRPTLHRFRSSRHKVHFRVCSNGAFHILSVLHGNLVRVNVIHAPFGRSTFSYALLPRRPVILTCARSLTSPGPNRPSVAVRRLRNLPLVLCHHFSRLFRSIYRTRGLAPGLLYHGSSTQAALL